MDVEERPVPKPQGTPVEITRVRRTTSHRYRETQPQFNQPAMDTVPGAGSGDQ